MHSASTLCRLGVVVGAVACVGAASAAPPRIQLPESPNSRTTIDADSVIAALLAGGPVGQGPGGTEVTLLAPACEGSGTIVVEIAMTGATAPVVGGQFFLEYDNVNLDFVSAVVGDAPYDLEVYEDVDEIAGTIDYAVGVTGGGPGTVVDTVMARLTFDMINEVCFEDALVAFRANVPPSRLTDDAAGEIAATFNDLGTVSLDVTNPVVTCPSDVLLYADAGFCSAVLPFLETYDLPVPVCGVQTPSCWYPDRYPPAVFANAVFDGGNRLNHGVDVADSQANRPPSFSSPFYNYQGHKRDVTISTGSTMTAEVWIPAAWNGIDRHASLWGETIDAGGFISGYPILGFTGNVDATTVPWFRAFVQDTDFDGSNGYTPGWAGLAIVTGFDRWYRFDIELTASSYEFTVTDLSTDTVVATLSDPIIFGSIHARNVFLQLYNYGDTYETWWDDVAVGPDGATVTDNCGSASLAAVRSDNPLLTMSDPFPVGTTFVTWTATDDCGNTDACVQEVEVLGDSQMDVTVELDGSFAGSFDRCVTFEFTEAGCVGTTVVATEMSFVGGTATGTVEIPCGDYVCATARDTLHTLRMDDLDDFGVAGSIYVADFTGGDALIGGNLNDDAYIDILDFGVYVGEFGASYGTADTTCATAAPHADVSGDGAVGTADFTFIQINFLEFAETGCCVPFAGPLDDARRVRRDGATATTGTGPVQRISIEALRERGMGDLAVADLNRDGWLDIVDVAAFAGGARP